MSQHSSRDTFAPARDAIDPALQPALDAAAGPPACIEDPDTPTPYIDANGFDPADYHWVPVRRRPRADGFTEAKQRAFIEMLADTGVVEEAASHVNMTVQSCYRLRRSPGAEGFAQAWNAAIQQAALRLVDLAFDRAINGSDEPVFDRDGRRVGRRMKPSDRMLIFLMRAHLPERYRHAYQDLRHPGEYVPPCPPPVAEAITALDPAPPAEPHLLMPPEELDVAIQVADLLDGELPRWCRPTDDDEDTAPMSLGEDFERRLAEAKAAGAHGAEDTGEWVRSPNLY